MGSSSSKPSETDYIEQIEKINSDDLDMSRIEKLQLEAIKELSNRMKKLEREKQTQMIYTIPKVDLCNWSLF